MLEAIVSNDDNLTYGAIISVYVGPDEAITALTEHGIEGNYSPPARGFHAPRVAAMVPKMLVPGVRRAVATTVLTSASPWAAHMAR